MHSLFGVATLVAFWTVWYTASKIDMRPESGYYLPAGPPVTQKKNTSSRTAYNNSFNNYNNNNRTFNHYHGHPVTQAPSNFSNHNQHRGQGQQTYGPVAPNPGYQGHQNNNRTNGYPPNGYGYQAPVPAAPLMDATFEPGQYANQNYMRPPGPAYAPMQNNTVKDQSYYVLPPPGQQLQAAPIPQQFINYAGVEHQHQHPKQPSFSVPPPQIPSQNRQNYYPPEQPIPTQQFQGPVVYSHSIPNPPNHVAKPPLFVNHQVIQPGSVFTNADGYTELYNVPVPNGYSHQPLVLDQYGEKRGSRDSVETPREEVESGVAAEPNPEAENDPVEEPALQVVPIPEEEQVPVVEEVVQEQEAAPEPEPVPVALPESLENFKFTGSNFPILPTDEVPEDVTLEHENLLATINNSVKRFFETKVDLWNQLQANQRNNNPEEYAFVNEPLTPDEGYAFNSNSVTPATDPGTVSPALPMANPVPDHQAPNVPDRENQQEEDTVTIDYFLPALPFKVPKCYLKSAEGNPTSNCLMLQSFEWEDVVEKRIQGDISKMDVDGKYLPIEFSRSEKQKIFELLRSGQEATIVMYTDSPNDPSDSQDREATGGSPNQDGSPVEEFPGTVNSPVSSNDGNPESSSDPSPLNGQSNGEQSRYSRLNGYTNQTGTPNRGRSSSSFGPTGCSRNYRNYPWDPRGYNLPNSIPTSSSATASASGEPRHNKPGPSRQLPAIPQHYLNGPSSSVDRPWVDFERHGVNGEAPIRRRHQSQDGASRVQNGQYPQPWMNEHPHLRFIVPTERQLMARVPFPPFRMPLIGVARRDPGQPYVPQRILPAHENFEIFRLRMQELQDSSIPNRGNGPLLLEPRGFMAHRVPAREGSIEQERPDPDYNVPSTSDGPRQREETGSDSKDLCDFKKRFLLEQEEARKRAEAATACRMVSPYQRYHHDSTDEDDDEGFGPNGFGAGAVPSSSQFTPTANFESSNTEQRSSQPSSSNNGNQRSEQKQRPVKDSAAKNQRRRERDQRRQLKKEEERIKKEEQEHQTRIEEDRKAAELELAAVKKRVQQEELARKLAREDEQRKIEEETKKNIEEQMKIEMEKQKAEKRRIINQVNKEKKKVAKQNKYMAKKKDEEEKKKQQSIVKSLLQNDIQHSVDMAILSRLAEAKLKMDMDMQQRTTTSQNVTSFLKRCENQVMDYEILKEIVDPVIIDLEGIEEVDTRTLCERSSKFDWFFKYDESFRADVKEQVNCSERGRFQMTMGICKIREAEAMKKYAATGLLIHAKAVRQYRYWMENMYNELSYFVNFVVGIFDLKEDDPTIEKFEQWAIYENEKYQSSITTFETCI